MVKVLQGDAITTNADMGFHKIAMQLAIAAHALGKSEDALISDAKGLCEKYVGDSSRYGSATKREAELRRMYTYMAENPCYTFSAGGIKACLEKGTPTPDLSALATADVSEEEDIEDIIEHSGMCTLRSGLFHRTQEGEMLRKSDAGLVNPLAIYVQSGGRVEHQGFLCDVYLNGKYHAQKQLWIADFQSKQNLQRAISSVTAASVGITDAQAGYLLDVLRKYTERNKAVSLTVCREGLNVVKAYEVPGVGATQADVVWVSPGQIISRNRDEDGNPVNKYQYQGPFGMKGQYNSDLVLAPRWTDLDPEFVKTVFDNLFKINEKEGLAKVFGWFCAAHFAPWFRVCNANQFPLLHIVGSAGTGKTSTATLMYQLHTYRVPAVLTKASNSPFSLEALVAGSSSIPMIVDEYKPRS